MARCLHPLLLLLTCLCVGAEVLLATPGLLAICADQVHDCGSTDARLTAEIEAGETELEPLAPIADPARVWVPRMARLAESVQAGGREGMRRHRWCEVDLN